MPRLVMVWVWTLVLGAWFVPLGNPARAAGGVLVAPARIEAIAHPGATLPPIQVTNRGDGPVSVLAQVVQGGHDLHGMPQLASQPWNRPGRTVAVTPSQFTLPAGATRQVTVRLDLAESPIEGLYPVILFQVDRPDAPEGTGPRIAVLLLLTPPKVASPSLGVTVEALAVEQRALGEPVAFTAVFRNDGRVHQRPAGAMRVVGPGGDEHAWLPVPPVTILPGAKRLVRTTWTPTQLLPGRYMAELRLDESPLGQPVPVSAPAATLAFQVLAPYEIAQTLGRFGPVGVTRVPDDPPQVHLAATVVNTGNVALLGHVEWVWHESGQRERLNLPHAVPPGQAVSVTGVANAPYGEQSGEWILTDARGVVLDRRAMPVQEAGASASLGPVSLQIGAAP